MDNDNYVSENAKKHLHNNPLQKLLIQRFHRNIFNLLNGLSVNSILDVGCGEGFVIRMLQNHKIDMEIFGTDINYFAINWGKNNLKINCNWVVSDIQFLPVPNNCFPVVSCLEVLEHVGSPIECLTELVRISANYVVISVPHEPFFRIANLLRGKNVIRFGNDIDHSNNFTGRSIRQIIPSNVQLISHLFIFPWQILLLKKE